MPVRCAACHEVRHTTAELPLDPTDRRRLGVELLRAVGPVTVLGRLADPLDLVAYPLNELRVPCPGCGASRWSDLRGA